MIISFSNNFVCSEMPVLDYEQRNAGELFPNQNIEVLIEEISQMDNSRAPMCERKSGIGMK